MQFFLCLNLGLGAHPLQPVNVLAHRLFDGLRHLQRALFFRRRERICHRSPPIRSSPSMSLLIACSMACVISSVRCFSAGGKYFATYTCPSASPSSRSTRVVQRFQRSCCFSAPFRICE